MWTQFLLENAHFAINIFVALVAFAVFWLYWDAWRTSRNMQQAPLVFGWLIVSLGFVILATEIEAAVLQAPVFGTITSGLGTGFLGAGLLGIIIGALWEPLQPLPSDDTSKSNAAIPLGAIGALGIVGLPILAVIAAWGYMRRATIGLEHHLKPISYGLLLVSISFLFSLAKLFQTTSNVTLYGLVAPFGLFWLVELAILLLGGIVLGKWVFTYLLEQFETQLFMYFTWAILAIFLITTVSFTGLLLRNIQNESLRQLETDVRVLQMALTSKRAESISDATLFARDDEVVTNLTNPDRKILNDKASEFLLSKKLNTLIVVSEVGQVVARGEDRERVGDVLTSDPLLKRALLGESASSVVSREGVVAPEIWLVAASPVSQGGTIIGAVLLGTAIDNAFVDGLKEATGLEASIYGGNQVAATTFVASDGRHRLVGLKEETAVIKTRVLTDGLAYTGSVSVAQVPHYASLLPLADIDNAPVGMLFVGRPQLSILQTAGRSIEMTFVVTALLLIISVLPAYIIARSIAKQLE